MDISSIWPVGNSDLTLKMDAVLVAGEADQFGGGGGGRGGWDPWGGTLPLGPPP